MKFFILFGLVALSQSYSDTPQDAQGFCNFRDLCNGRTPIACYFTQSTNMWCDGQEVNLDKAQVLKLHNDYRQKLASGGYPPLPTAAKMTELQWNDDLALIASYNARRCQYGHDECRNTPQFPLAGQNIATKGSYGYPWDENTSKANVVEMIDSWFGEYKDCPPEQIDSYNNPQSMIGHFTQMAKDQATHVGCSAVYYKETDSSGTTWDNIYLVCNYARTNVYGEATYVSGSPASQCKQRSSNYPALCSV